MVKVYFSSQYGKVAFVLSGLTKEQNSEVKKILQMKDATIEKTAKKDGTYYIIYNPDAPETSEVTKVKAAMNSWGSFYLVPFDDFMANATATTDEAGLVYNGPVLIDYVGTNSEITVPEGIEEICEYAFSGNTNITKVRFPDTVKTIGDYAFYGCENLTVVDMPHELTRIGSNVFDYCKKLSSLEFPDTLTAVGIGSFFHCYSLAKINVPSCVINDDNLAGFIADFSGDIVISPNNKKYISEDGGVYNSDKTTVFYHETADRCVLPETVTNIYDSFFGSDLGPRPSYKQLVLPVIMTDLSEEKIRRLFSVPFDNLLCSEKIIAGYYNYLLKDLRWHKSDLIKLGVKMISKKIAAYNDEAEWITKELFKKFKEDILGFILEKSDPDAMGEYLTRLSKVSIDKIDELIERAGNKTEIKAVLMEYKNKRFTKAAVEKKNQDTIDKELGIKERSPAEWKKEFMLKNVGEDGICIEKYKGSEELAYIPEMIGKRRVVGINMGRFIDNPVKLWLPNSLIVPRSPISRSEIGPGSMVEFGQYFISENTVAPIKWRVLDVRENEALLISDKVIDYMFYHLKRESIYWKDSDLRKWLNNTFYSFAFSSEEQKIIIEKEIKTPPITPGAWNYYASTPEIVTLDRVFLFSTDEVEHYYQKGEYQALPTEYQCSVYNRIHAANPYLNPYRKEIGTDDSTDWVLRSGAKSGNAAVSIVNHFGEITGGRTTWVNSYFGVRPAIWISIGE